jgi:predicted small integral membrane protein
MIIRLCKISLAATTALFLVLVVFNNLTDYPSNYAFIEGVMSMKDTWAYERNSWRAIDAVWMHNAFYVSIILWEAVAAGLIIFGLVKLTKALKADAATFQKAKTWALAGLTLSMLQWYLAFITVGGEWFLMWQNTSWNGQDAAFRMFAMMGFCLLFLYWPEPAEPAEA